jgi:hypothetical protein
MLIHLSLVRAHKIQVAELQATVADLKAQQVMQQATATQSAERSMHSNFPQFHRQRRSLDSVSFGWFAVCCQFHVFDSSCCLD